MLDLEIREKRWALKAQAPKADAEALATELNVSPVLANLLIQRGVHTFEQARKFFRPDLSELYDPFLMKDMDVAVNRLIEAIHGRQKIMVYGDYDVDDSGIVMMTR